MLPNLPPEHMQKNLKPQLDLALAQLEAWGDRPNTTRLKGLVNKIRKLGVDTGCLDETLQEYIDTPPGEESERTTLLDRMASNICTIIEDYELDWEEHYDQRPSSAPEHPLFARWKEEKDKLDAANSRPHMKNCDPYIIVYFFEMEDGRLITFGKDAENVARYFDMEQTVEEGSVALVVTRDQYNYINRNYRGKDVSVYAHKLDGSRKVILSDDL